MMGKSSDGEELQDGSMLHQYLRKLFDMLNEQENFLKSELKQVEQQIQTDSKQRTELTDEVQRLEKSKALEKMQHLQGLERLIEQQRQTERIVNRELEQLENVRSELKQLEFRSRITLAEIEANNLRKRREEINAEMIPRIESQMSALLDERQQIDSRLLNLNEEISLLRRRTQSVIEKD